MASEIIIISNLAIIQTDNKEYIQWLSIFLKMDQ